MEKLTMREIFTSLFSALMVCNFLLGIMSWSDGQPWNMTGFFFAMTIACYIMAYLIWKDRS